jgi:HEAT repeat protein
MIGFPSMLALSNVIDHGDAKARGDAITILMRYRQSMRQVIPPLIKMANAENPESRTQALGALGALRFVDDASLTTLIEALKDPAPEVRMAAIRSLTLVGRRAEPAVPNLIGCLHDEIPGIREAAIKALGELGPRAHPAVPELRRLAENDPDPALRGAAAQALGKIEVAEKGP